VATRFRDLSGKEYWKLTWPFLLSLVVGCALRYLSPRICRPYWLPTDFVSAFADALIIAGILGLLLELFATRLLIEKVSNDLADKLVGRGLPPELQSHIRTIVNTGFVRDHFVKVYKLSLPDTPSRVQLDVTLTFEVRNYSDVVRDYVPTFQDETFYYPEFLSLEYGLVGQRRYCQTVEEISPATKVKTVKAKEAIKLEPFRRNDKAVCEVTMRYRLKMPKEYSDITSFADATLGAVVRVESVPPEFDFVSAGERAATHPNGDKSWYFDGPFIKNQHIRVWWFQKYEHPV